MIAPNCNHGGETHRCKKANENKTVPLHFENRADTHNAMLSEHNENDVGNVTFDLNQNEIRMFIRHEKLIKHRDKIKTLQKTTIKTNKVEDAAFPLIFQMALRH